MKHIGRDILKMKNLVTTKNIDDILLIGEHMIELPKRQTRYVIVDDENGIFLGTYTMADFKQKIEEEFLGEDEYIPPYDLDRSFALFAKDNPFSVPRACSFETREEARRFILDSFGPTAKKLRLKTAPVQTASLYPDVVDLIKSDLGHMTFDMLDGLDIPSKYPH